MAKAYSKKSKAQADNGSAKGKRVALLTVGVLLVSGAIWAFASGGDKQLRELDQLRERMANLPEEMSREERREAWGEYREKLNQLTPEQRERWREMEEERMEARFEARLDRVFAMSPEERKKEIDRDIDRMEAMMQRMADGGGRGRRGGDALANRGGGPPGAGGGQTGPGGRRGDGATGGGSRQREAGSGSGRGRGYRDPEMRQDRRKQRLDNSTPERRAKFTEYRRLVSERRKERGLPDRGWGRGPR